MLHDVMQNFSLESNFLNSSAGIKVDYMHIGRPQFNGTMEIYLSVRFIVIIYPC